MFHVPTLDHGIGVELILLVVVDQVLIDHLLALPCPFFAIDLGVIQKFITRDTKHTTSKEFSGQGNAVQRASHDACKWEAPYQSPYPNNKLTVSHGTKLNLHVKVKKAKFALIPALARILVQPASPEPFIHLMEKSLKGMQAQRHSE
jgi:hypothetical protein